MLTTCFPFLTKDKHFAQVALAQLHLQTLRQIESKQIVTINAPQSLFPPFVCLLGLHLLKGQNERILQGLLP